MRGRMRTFGVGVAVVLLVVAVRPTAAEDRKPATGSVEGKVSYKGKPLPGGIVGFHLASGKLVLVKLKADGSYRVPVVPVGAAKITVETKPAKPVPGGKPAQFIAIPKKYASPETSGITYTVLKGKQTFNIELK